MYYRAKLYALTQQLSQALHCTTLYSTALYYTLHYIQRYNARIITRQCILYTHYTMQYADTPYTKYTTLQHTVTVSIRMQTHTTLYTPSQGHTALYTRLTLYTILYSIQCTVHHRIYIIQYTHTTLHYTTLHSPTHTHTQVTPRGDAPPRAAETSSRCGVRCAVFSVRVCRSLSLCVRPLHAALHIRPARAVHIQAPVHDALPRNMPRRIRGVRCTGAGDSGSAASAASGTVCVCVYTV